MPRPNMQGGERMIPEGQIFRADRTTRQISDKLGRLHYVNYYDASVTQLLDACEILTEALDLLPQLEEQLAEMREIVEARLVSAQAASPGERTDDE